jgi:hypothetical protein
MKTKTLIFTAVLCLIGAVADAAPFSSGSTGADGALLVTSSRTLDLPPDGVFHFTTITITNSATLKFNRNALNTPVFLLASGNVYIDGTIDISATGQLGGPGGFDGGYGVFPGQTVNGDGQGPGGGSGSTSPFGVFATASGSNTNVYGNTLIVPMIGGSGGAGSANIRGGGGGGALLIASSTNINFASGTIRAYGGYCDGCQNNGSGGAVRLVAPIVTGRGFFAINNQSVGYNGSYGRLRIDCEDRFAWRSLQINGAYAGVWTRGHQMFVFPRDNPRLDIIAAAGTTIPAGTNGSVAISLPLGSSTNQIIRVQAQGFTNDVPIRVKITPENAPSATFDGIILQSSGNPPFADVQVTLPVDTVCHVHAWTR